MQDFMSVFAFLNSKNLPQFFFILKVCPVCGSTFVLDVVILVENRGIAVVEVIPLSTDTKIFFPELFLIPDELVALLLLLLEFAFKHFGHLFETVEGLFVGTG